MIYTSFLLLINLLLIITIYKWNKLDNDDESIIKIEKNNSINNKNTN